MAATLARSSAPLSSIFPLPSSGVSTAFERAVTHRSKTAAGVDPHAAVTIRIAHGVLAMMRARRFNAVHIGHHMSIGSDRRLFRAELHAGGAVQSDPRQRDWPIGTHHAVAELGDWRQIVDDADSHASGSPISRPPLVAAFLRESCPWSVSTPARPPVPLAIFVAIFIGDNHDRHGLQIRIPGDQADQLDARPCAHVDIGWTEEIEVPGTRRVPAVHAVHRDFTS